MQRLVTCSAAMLWLACSGPAPSQGGGGGQGGGGQADSGDGGDGGAAGGDAADGGAATDSGPEGPARGSMGSGGPAGFLDNQELEVGGKKHSYAMQVPADLDPDKPVPLLFYLHGAGLPTDELGIELKGVQLDKAANDKGFIAVAPLGCYAPSIGGAAWCPSDLTFLDALLEHLESQYNIDRKKIYVVGFSAGGFMAGIWAFPRSEVITAIGICGAGFGMGSDPGLAKRKLPIFLRVLKGDYLAGGRAAVDKLRALGWAESDLDTEVGVQDGGHTYLTSYNGPLWDFFSQFETP